MPNLIHMRNIKLQARNSWARYLLNQLGSFLPRMISVLGICQAFRHHVGLKRGLPLRSLLAFPEVKSAKKLIVKNFLIMKKGRAVFLWFDWVAMGDENVKIFRILFQNISNILNFVANAVSFNAIENGARVRPDAVVVPAGHPAEVAEKEV